METYLAESMKSTLGGLPDGRVDPHTWDRSPAQYGDGRLNTMARLTIFPSLTLK